MTKTEHFANDFAAAVVSAFSEFYGPPRNADVKGSVHTSWSEESVRQGWTEPDPRFVVVGTEDGWINDPWSSDRDHQLWDKAVNSLMRDGWGDVHWDSINPGVHTVFIDLPSAWHGVLIKRAMEKGKGQR
jgi:hypothetical protein